MAYFLVLRTIWCSFVVRPQQHQLIVRFYIVAVFCLHGLGWSPCYFCECRRISMVASSSFIIWWCEVTGRRCRVSPCRSTYYASPWWLLTLGLRRRKREAALLFPESWWHLKMWGSRPSHFMIIPNTKRHPNNIKTDQLPISEVIQERAYL